MKKHQEIEIPILNTEYKVIVCFGDKKQIMRVLKAYQFPTDFDLGSYLENNRGLTIYHPDCHPVIAMPKRPTTPTEIGSLAHEAVHAVEHIFIGIKEPLGGEIFAHSVGAIIRLTLK